MRPVELKIPGAHNLENALAACAIAFFGGIPAEVIAKVLREFNVEPGAVWNHRRYTFCQ